MLVYYTMIHSLYLVRKDPYWGFLQTNGHKGNNILRVENKGLVDHKWKRMCEERVSKEELVRLRRAFAIFDVDGDGTITTEVSQKAWLLKQWLIKEL